MGRHRVRSPYGREKIDSTVTRNSNILIELYAITEGLSDSKLSNTADVHPDQDITLRTKMQWDLIRRKLYEKLGLLPRIEIKNVIENAIKKLKVVSRTQEHSSRMF